MTLRIEAVTLDALDPVALGRFWAGALGWQARTDADGDVWVEPAGSAGSALGAPLLLLAVPERKAGKNRVHLDLRPDDQAAEVRRLQSLGASPADVGQTGDEGWVVMADPEGNEFCVLEGRPAGAVRAGRAPA